jgi:hypothetical protein
MRGLPARFLFEVDDPGPEAGAETCEPLPKLSRSHVAAFRLPLETFAPTIGEAA